MSKLFTKLNLKDQQEIFIANAPDTFSKEMEALKDVRIVEEIKNIHEINFALIFVKTTEEIKDFAESISKKAPGDVTLWFAYPKKSSKKYEVNIHRDKGWEALEQLGFKGVRQVAIDQDWSALRFRRQKFVGS